eukprot:6334332-Amphidinium_carterae.1
MDISFFNEVAYYNSRLLRCYAEFDKRAMGLGLLIKHWAKRRKINSPFHNGTLSSYSYTLMVVHYLQRCNILPNLQNPRLLSAEERCRKVSAVFRRHIARDLGRTRQPKQRVQSSARPPFLKCIRIGQVKRHGKIVSLPVLQSNRSGGQWQHN